MAPSENVASTIWLEYSYGRFDVGDVGEFRSLLKNLISSSASYAYFINYYKKGHFMPKMTLQLSGKIECLVSFGSWTCEII